MGKILAPFVLYSLLTFASLGSAATLSGTFYDPGSDIINLSAEGTLDWGHWGLVTEWTYNHKYGVPQQITYSFITVTGIRDFLGQPLTALATPAMAPRLCSVGRMGRRPRRVDWTDGAIYMWGDKLPTNKPPPVSTLSV